MAYDETLAERVRRAMGPRLDVSEKKMFGGLAFMLGEKMFIGIVGEDLMVRVGPERQAQALAEPHARPMDFTGRPMKGFVYVAPRGASTEKSLRKWIAWAETFVGSLDAKPKKRRAGAKARPPKRNA